LPERQITDQERNIAERARKVLPGGSLGNIGTGIVIADGKAGRVRDASGNEYIDYLMGSGPMLIGHAHPEVIAAVHQQLDKGTTFFANNEHAIELAEHCQRRGLRRQGPLHQ